MTKHLIWTIVGIVVCMVNEYVTMFAKLQYPNQQLIVYESHSQYLTWIGYAMIAMGMWGYFEWIRGRGKAPITEDRAGTVGKTMQFGKSA